MRPEREHLHMLTAMMWAQRALCSLPDRKCGALIVTPDLRRIVSFGYNGPARGLPDDYCQHWRDTRKQLPMTGLRRTGDDTATLSRCPCLHAEDNAIAGARESTEGCVLFVTMEPCLPCSHRIVNAGIKTVRYLAPYRDKEGVELLTHRGVDARRSLLPHSTDIHQELLGLLATLSS